MQAVERGAAVNTLAAYRRDLEGAKTITGNLVKADRIGFSRLAER